MILFYLTQNYLQQVEYLLHRVQSPSFDQQLYLIHHKSALLRQADAYHTEMKSTENISNLRN